jgi:hypothetical protein
MMITLPAYPPQRVWLKSFALAASLWLLLIGILLSVLTSPRWLVIGGLAALVLALTGSRWPRIASIPYRIWNKAAFTYRKAACAWLVGIGLYVVFFILGRAGSDFRLGQPAKSESLWVRRSGTDARNTRSGLREATSGKHFSDLSSWISSEGKWGWFLLLFFRILSIVEPEQHEAAEPPSSIYTLY